jgi:hypothetical protein
MRELICRTRQVEVVGWKLDSSKQRPEECKMEDANRRIGDVVTCVV